MKFASCAVCGFPRHIVALIFFLLLSLGGGLSASLVPEWKPTTWHGEKAWESTSFGWTAIISEERARLVSIADVGENLLYAPPKGAVSRGGHRCWLGPQSGWQREWPPASDWEVSAAASVNADGTLLTLTHPHTDAKYPALSRTYQWRGGVLHCKLKWQGGLHHAIHILQLPQWSVVHVRRSIAKDLPLGYAWPQTIGPIETITDVALPSGVSQVDGDEITLWHANLTAKIAFAPQEITAEIGAYQLKMRCGAVSGVTAISPNLGLLTQVYLGDWENPFVELEQLSPFADGRSAACEILIEPIRPKLLEGASRNNLPPKI